MIGIIDQTRFSRGPSVSGPAGVQRRRLIAGGVGALMMGVLPLSRAEDPYPNRPIRILVGAGAGGTTDITARLIGAQLGKVLGQVVLIENRAGAAGTLSMQQTTRAAPDGYTLVWVGNSVMAIAPYLYKNPGYDVKAMIPVSLGATSSFVLVCAPNLGFDDLKGMIAYGKAHPGQLTFGSNGVNGSLHLLGELLKNEAGFDALHVPFKGGAESANAIMSGNVSFLFDALSSNLALIESGKLKALAVTGAHREKSLPNVPTMAELGLPSMTAEIFFGLVAPPSTPHAVVDELAGAMKLALADPALREKLSKTGNEAQSSTPAEFRDRIDKEGARYQALIKAKGIQPE